MENLEEMLDREKSQKILKYTFEGVPEEYAFGIFSVVVNSSVSYGLKGGAVPNGFEIEDNRKLSPEQKEKILACAKKLYSLGYAIGADAKEKAKPENGKIRIDRLEYVIERAAKIFENVVYYEKNSAEFLAS